MSDCRKEEGEVFSPTGTWMMYVHHFHKCLRIVLVCLFPLQRWDTLSDTLMSSVARAVVSFIETRNEQNPAGSLGGLSQTNLQGGLPAVRFDAWVWATVLQWEDAHPSARLLGFGIYFTPIKCPSPGSCGRHAALNSPRTTLPLSSQGGLQYHFPRDYVRNLSKETNTPRRVC